ncbi:4Fe-4S binding protein [Pseudanabaena sp. FACHB-1998]|uniref:NIL domain-containing protein n=1 Tax=Pseudanabaena sp. FACHB-1998 TaxID=2692858 RepID=UPI001681A93C|nr:NIL domain-containing protein [Pseudanabaena sp. FACHB-1998]MBD2175928.1 4Fe-4S binding protein [Pseudanabaena sp. FACHB-1998]
MKKRVNLTFPKRAINIPLTYRLAKDFNIAANIIRAQVAPNKVGKMVLELSGDIDQLEEAMDWMRSQDIEVSLHGREIVIDDTTCVDCGVCTGVCPTEALTLDPKTFQLNFLRSRCVVCEQCIAACPVNAISINL